MYPKANVVALTSITLVCSLACTCYYHKDRLFSRWEFFMIFLIYINVICLADYLVRTLL